MWICGPVNFKYANKNNSNTCLCIYLWCSVFANKVGFFFFKSDRFFANKDRAWLEWGCKGDVAPHGLNMYKKKKNTIPFLKSVMRFGLSVCELDKKLAL